MNVVLLLILGSGDTSNYPDAQRGAAAPRVGRLRQVPRDLETRGAQQAAEQAHFCEGDGAGRQLPLLAQHRLVL